jgi:hypothetical protein
MEPRIQTINVNYSGVDTYFTQQCGFEVQFFNRGTFKAQLFVDKAGTIVREIDTFPGDTAGWASPASGRRIAWPNGAELTMEYPHGTAVGSAAKVTGHGLAAKIPGIPADAGTAEFAGHIVAIEDDVPIVAFDQLVSINGQASDPGVFDGAVCAALSP